MQRKGKPRLPPFSFVSISTHEPKHNTHYSHKSLHHEHIVSLRLQVSSEKVVEKAFGEYAFCCLLLFFVVFNFIG
jgi:hypothetical protein